MGEPIETQTGFFLQLRLLLWKNLTLKRRKFITLIFELFIPLVLFVIVVAIRRQQPAVENPASTFQATPLPSAGIIPVLQSFCDEAPQADEHGFSSYVNSSIHAFLSQMKTVAENKNFFLPGFSLDELTDVPKIYRSIIEDPIMLKSYFESNTTDIRIEYMLNNPKLMENFLAQNMSFEQSIVRKLLYEQLDKNKLYDTLFYNPNITNIFGANQFFGNTHQDRRRRNIHNDLFSNEIEEGLFYNAIRSMNYSSSDGYMLRDPETILNLMKNVIIEESLLTKYLCDGAEHAPIWRKCDSDCKSEFLKLSGQYCAMDTVNKIRLKEFVRQNINITKLLSKMHITAWNKEQADERFRTFINDIEVFMKFKRSVRELRKLADSFPQKYCHANFTQVNDGEMSEGLESDEVTTVSVKDHKVQKTDLKTPKNGTYMQKPSHPFLNIWKAMHKTLCGKELKLKGHHVESIDDLELSSFQIDKFKVLTHILYNNPKILYVPTGTMADRLIGKANQTFALLDEVNQYISTFQSVGQEIKSFITLETTKINLQILRKMQKDMSESPMGALFFNSLIVQEFISDPNITDGEEFVKELEVISLSACSWSRLMQGLTFNIYKGFQTEDKMLKYFKTQAFIENVTVLAGVVFHMNDDGSLPNHIIYKIRQNASLTYDTNRIRSRFWFPGPRTNTYNYYKFGFLWIQDILERSMIDLHAEKDINEPGTYLQQFPYPCYVQDSFLFMIQHVMPMCLTISWVYSVAMLVQYIVYEKEQRLKEIMRMMGMRNFVHWISWFLTSLTQMTITVGMLTLILKYGKILSYSDPWIIFITMEVYAISLIMFSFLVSVLYSKAKIAAACAGIMYFMAYVPYMYIAVREEAAQETVPSWVKAVASILAPTAFGLGAKYFAFYEEIGVGLQWENIANSPVDEDDYNLGAVLVMLTIDSLIYLILFWYIENVFPGLFGLPRPWYFPIQKSYWWGEKLHTKNVNNKSPENNPEASRKTFRFPFFRRNNNASDLAKARHYSFGESVDERAELFEMEPENSDLVVGVDLSNLSKRYKGANKFAVRDINMTLYEGQVTALLGPVGSGKSTIMSILTGLFPPTTGTATIYGHDIRTGMDQIRNSLGICTQHNTLFENLTVEEHIWFYATLKGQKKDRNDEDADADEVDNLIQNLNFQSKRHQKVFCLSGGMKRKLSVAIAFVGGSRAVFVDEPTAGVDPATRRAIWDLIIKYKAGRTILFSTHHMDEADILGDRIAIVESGRIKCFGSPLYLKHHLADGYHLTILKKMNPKTMFRTSNCCAHTVTTSIKAVAPETRFIKESRNELNYFLSMKDLRAGNFVKLFRMLASSLDNLHISSYGLKSTTLEEVFMKVTTDKECQNLSSQDDDSICPSEIQSVDGFVGPINIQSSEQSAIDTNNSTLSTVPEINVSCSGDADEPNCNVIPNENESVLEIPDCISDSFNADASMLNKTPLDTITGNRLIFQQFCAILKKRYLCTKRNIEGLFSQVLLPAFFVSVAMSVALTAPEVQDLPELILTPSQYKESHKFQMKSHESVFVYSNNKMDLLKPKKNNQEASSEDIVQSLKLPSGIGATCVLHNPFSDSGPWHFSSSTIYLLKYFDSMCEGSFTPTYPVNIEQDKEKDSIIYSFINNNTIPFISRERFYPICYCAEEKTTFICPRYGFKDPKSFKVVTGERVIDISGQNESQYYLYTTDKFRLQRYGGISLGIMRNATPSNFGATAPRLFRQIAVGHVGKVWYNNKGYHAMPTYLNVMNNAILRANVPKHKGHPSGYGITVINHPFPNTQNSFMYDEILKGNEVLIAIFIIVAMSFVPASFVLFVVYERYNKSKHLQIISGVHPAVYLTANYIWDVCNYVVPAAFIVTILLIFDVPAYTSGTNFPAVVALFLMYGWCISPIMHCVSYLFEEPSSAYIFLIVINLFVGITCIVTSFLLEVFSSDTFLRNAHTFLKALFLVFPNYCLGRGLMDMAFNEYYSMYLVKTGQSHKVKFPFDWEIIGKNLVAMAVTGIAFFVITLLLELKMCICCNQRKYEDFLEKGTGSSDSTAENLEDGEFNEDEDIDVVNERNRILTTLNNDDVLRVENLSKVYSTKKLGKLLAVNRLSWGVPAGECFGLLGVNGSGKTSTFKLLTGDSVITAGDVFINGFSVKNSMDMALSNVGYCPQFDALYDELSATEHLHLFAALRGIPKHRRSKIVEQLICRLDLTQYSDVPCGTYSGGNRRKLSAAIALVGSPSVIFLDEPTSGQDPRSRRFLWDLILSLVKEGKSVVFTSHEMEECEVLVTRLAIMVNGRFKCLGSIQHLKNKFGNGYSITVRCSKSYGNDSVLKVAKYLKKKFHHAVEKEHHWNIIRFEVSSEFVSLDDIFSKMEKARTEILLIEDYSVSQNTLDNVFINFAKLQNDYHLPQTVLQEKAALAQDEENSDTESAALERKTALKVQVEQQEQIDMQQF